MLFPMTSVITSLPTVMWQEGRVDACLLATLQHANGVPHIRPQNYPFPLTDPQTQLQWHRQNLVQGVSPGRQDLRPTKHNAGQATVKLSRAQSELKK